MPFGSTVTSYIADLFPNDPLAPQVVGDFAQPLPPSPIKGELISHFADTVLPASPIHPLDIGTARTSAPSSRSSSSRTSSDREI